MFALEFDVDDLAAARFAVSPAHQIVDSLTLLHHHPQPLHADWIRRVRDEPNLDHDLLRSLVSPDGWVPDFLSPVPAGPRTTVVDQLAQIRLTPADTVVNDVRATFEGGPLPDRIMTVESNPVELRDEIADVVHDYWRVAIEPHWPRMRAILEADVLYRGSQFAQCGPATAFSQLDPRIHWQDGTLAVDIIDQWQRRVPVAGRRAQIITTVFGPCPGVPLDVRAAPFVTYPARQTAWLWQSSAPPTPSAMRALIGARRADLLWLLERPMSTKDLSQRLGVTPSAVSHQLGVLSAAGLVVGTRLGRVVLYHQTDIGRRLAGSPAGDRSRGRQATARHRDRLP